MKYKLVVFDFDGTLADSFPWLVSVINEVADRYRFKRLDQATIEQLRGVDANKAIAQTGVPAWKVPLIGNHVRNRMGRDIHTIQVFPGVPAMLRHLAAANVQLAMLSSNTRPNIERVLGTELAALFAYYECGVSMLGKQAKLRALLKRSGVERGEVLCVGDELRDIAAAHAERVAFGAVTWGYARREALAASEPLFVFDSVEDIVTKLCVDAQNAA